MGTLGVRSEDLQNLAASYPTADTAACETEFLVPSPQLVCHIDHLTGARAPHGMAERDAAAPQVGAVSRELRQEVKRRGEYSGKCLIDFE